MKFIDKILVILSDSEVSIKKTENGLLKIKFCNGIYGFFAFLQKAQNNKGFKPLQTPPSRLCIAKSKFSMKRVPIKGGAFKGSTALFCKI